MADEELPGSLSTRSMHTPPLPHGGAGSGDAVIELPRRPTRSPRLSPRRRVEEELDAVYGARDASSAQLQAVQSRIDELSVSDDGEMQRRELARVVQGHKKRHEAYDEVIAASAAERARIIAEEARAKGSGPASSRRPRRRSSGSAGFDALPFPGALPEEARAAVEDPVEPRDILAAV